MLQDRIWKHSRLIKGGVMRRVKRTDKHGAGTIFIAIILSALVLVECTYLAFVWDLDRRMEVSRALKNEVEAILADYDRGLFKTYGIYAFSIDDVDDEIFGKVLQGRGYGPETGVTVNGIEVLDRDSLRKVISSYYAYRGAGIAFRSMFEQVSGIVDRFDDRGVIGRIRQFTSSGAARYLSDILSDSESISDRLESLTPDNGDLSEYVPGLQSIKDLMNDSNDDVTAFRPDLRLVNMSYLIEGYSILESMIDLGSGFASGRTDHLMLAHYAAYNFDCMVDNGSDSSVTGTKFSDIHGENYLDSEYIMTGLDGRFGMISVSTLIFETLFVKNFLNETGDPGKAMAYETAAILATTLVAALSDGTVEIPNEVMKLILVAVVAICRSVKELNQVYDGSKIALIEEDNMELVKVGYRDFLFLYLFCVNDDCLLDRMLSVLERDYGQMCTGISLSTVYGGTDYDITKRYAMYE